MLVSRVVQEKKLLAHAGSRQARHMAICGDEFVLCQDVMSNL